MVRKDRMIECPVGNGNCVVSADINGNGDVVITITGAKAANITGSNDPERACEVTAGILASGGSIPCED